MNQKLLLRPTKLNEFNEYVVYVKSCDDLFNRLDEEKNKVDDMNTKLKLFKANAKHDLSMFRQKFEELADENQK